MKLPLNQVLCGDNRKIMKVFPGNSIDLAVTSPPYWGLRDYGEIEAIWGGEAECEHEWVNTPPPRQRNEADIQDPDSKQATMRGTNYNSQEGNICTKCGGSGYIRVYFKIDNGVCFKCNKDGHIPAPEGWGEMQQSRMKFKYQKFE